MNIRSFKPKIHKQQALKRNNNNQNIQVQEVSPKGFGGKKQKTLRLIPIGGVGDIQKNMYVYEYGDDIVIIDCGVGFPDEGMLGIDLVIPDISYLRDKKHKIRGIIITHAHDDHIGGLPYIWPELNVPIYSQKLTCGMIKGKFTEHNLPKDKIKTCDWNTTLNLGVFTVNFYRVSHSIPDSSGIVLRTPVGTIIHQADFKMDWTPVNGQTTDVAKVARYGEAGVVFMTIDCLRVEKAGYTLSEKSIEGTYEKVERETLGKVLITMTSSNITRVQQAINVAVKSGRKIALSGRSVENNFQIARDLGYLDVPPGLIIAQEQIKRFQDNKMIVLIAGSQGQPGSALYRAAHGDHKYVELKPKDSVVFSADPIPSTETSQNHLIDLLVRTGCNVYYSAIMSDLHVSGHAAAEELKVMLNLAKPKYILPIGGNYKHMKSFANMALDMGYREDQVFLTVDGEIIEITPGNAKTAGKIPVSNVYVDGLGVGDIGSVVLKDRQLMSAEGMVVVILPLDKKTGMFTSEPDIISRGFVFEETSEDLLDAAKEIVKGSLHPEKVKSRDNDYIRHQVEEQLDRFFYEETKRNPMILPIVVES